MPVGNHLKSSPAAGAVYTPPALAAFVVDRLLDGHDGEGRWLDPCCGDGVFLLEAVRRVAARVPTRDLPGVIEARLLGVDIDRAACTRARAAVRAAVSQLAGPLPADYFDANVVCADFLSLDPVEVSKFDVVVGNPPYVSAVQLSASTKRDMLQRFPTAWGRLDLYLLFFEHALSFLGPRGSLAYITPDKFLTAISAKRLRAFIAARFHVRTVDRFDRHDLFRGVSTVPCVTVISSRADGEPPRQATQRWWDVQGGVPQRVSEPHVIDVPRNGRAWGNRAERAASTASVPLGGLVDKISAGWATGLNRCFMIDLNAAKLLEPVLLRDIVRGRDIARGYIRESGLRMLVPYRFSEGGTEPELIDLDAFPAVRAHLEAHRDALERRHCVRVWRKAWFDLHDPVMFDLARRDKILVPDVAREPRFALDSRGRLPVHSAYYLLPRPDAEITPAALVAVLNTPTVAEELRRRAPTAKSGYRRFRAQYLRDIRVPRLTVREQEDVLSDPASGELFDERVAHARQRHAA